MNSCNIWNITSQFREMLGSHKKEGTCIHRLCIYVFWRKNRFLFSLSFFFLNETIVFQTNKTFPLRKAQEVVKEREECVFP